jgi:hypothetical protein
MLRLVSPYFYRNFMKWRQLKGKYEGKRIFIIGNGPSLNKTPLYLLKNEYTICFNRFNLMFERLNWHPKFYAIIDTEVALDMVDEINEITRNTDFSFLPDANDGKLKIKEEVDSMPNVLFFHGIPLSFSNHLPWLSYGNTIAFPAFQIMKHLGFSEIYFCGIDANYKIDTTSKIIEEVKLKGDRVQVITSEADDDHNHFDPRYFGKGRTYHQPTQLLVDKLIGNMNTVYENTRKSNIKVVNVGYDSKIKVFDKMDFYEALSYSEERIRQSFESLVITFHFKSLDHFLKSVNNCKDSSEWDDSKEVNALKTNQAIRILKSKIFDAIPIGPFEGYIYFIKR